MARWRALPAADTDQMKGSLSLSAVSRRTFGIYAEQAPVLLVAGITAAAVIALDHVRLKHSPILALAALLVNLVVIGLFVCVVVLLAADAWDGGPRRPIRELLRGAWSALGPLLLVGVVAGITITLLVSVASVLALAVIASVVLSAGEGPWAVILGLLILPALLLVPELFLFTIWSVLAAVAVLERPGGLRALGRSRELVRGNGWRVLVAILMLALPLILAGAAERATETLGSVPAIAAGLVAQSLIAPIPVLVATALYFELRRAESTPAPPASTSRGLGSFE